MTSLHLEKTVEDERGKILFLVQNDKKINIVEIKKGFARGGHYHNFTSEHIIISGILEYREENIETKKEKIDIITAPSIIKVLPNLAHLFIALEDTIFVETFKEYNAIPYPSYRRIVEERMKTT